MGRVMVFTSGKGGVGKTTMAANLAYCLASMGRKVALVDFDLGLRNLDICLGLEQRVIYHLGDVLEGVCFLRQALIKDKRFPNLCFLPGVQKVNASVEQNAWTEMFYELKRQFDDVLVDGPAGMEYGFQLSLSMADEIYLILNPEICSVRDGHQVINYALANYDVPIRIVVNRTRKKTMFCRDYLCVKDIEDILRRPIYGEIPNDERLISFVNKGDMYGLRHRGIGIAVQRLGNKMIGESIGE